MSPSNRTVIETHRGDLVCRPVHWTDIVKFLLFNFVLHAVTVIPRPGDGIVASTMNRLFSFFLPLFGSTQALEAIHNFARGQKHPLQIAHRAGALCMLLRGQKVSSLSHR